MGLLSLLYTLMGGIEAVIWTDAMQVIILLGGALLSVFFIIYKIDGGFFEIINSSDTDVTISNTAFPIPKIFFFHKFPAVK